MGERIGVEQAIIFRGEDIEEVIEKYNKFNKENENIEFVSFTITSDTIGEIKNKIHDNRENIEYVFGEPYGIYSYVEYVKDKLFGGGFG